MAQPYDEQKRAAVLAALLAGQSVSQVARDYRVSRRAVQSWRDAAGINRAPVAQEKQDEIAELVAGVLVETLAAVQVLAQQAHDEEWRRKQSASDLAVLYGVFTDKAVRILEAIESAGPAEVDAAPPPETA